MSIRKGVNKHHGTHWHHTKDLWSIGLTGVYHALFKTCIESSIWWTIWIPKRLCLTSNENNRPENEQELSVKSTEGELLCPRDQYCLERIPLIFYLHLLAKRLNYLKCKIMSDCNTKGWASHSFSTNLFLER